MFKRLFFTAVGLGAGVAVGVWAVKKVEATRAKLTPEYAGRVTAARAEGLRGRVAEAVAVGRVAAAEKEAELRDVYRVREERRAAAHAQPPGAPWASRPAAAPPGGSPGSAPSPEA